MRISCQFVTTDYSAPAYAIAYYRACVLMRFPHKTHRLLLPKGSCGLIRCAVTGLELPNERLFLLDAGNRVFFAEDPLFLQKILRCKGFADETHLFLLPKRVRRALPVSCRCP